MLEFLIEVVGEFLLQAVGELLLELGLNALAEPFQREPKPWLAVLGYGLLGALLGGVSLWFFPQHMVPHGWRPLNLVLTPVMVGGLMMLMGRWRARRGQPGLRLDRFGCGFVFAFTLALVRFIFAT